MTEEAAPALQSLANFRDVAESINKHRQQNVLKQGLFFRSARPDELTDVDRDALVNSYGIKTIIDLRTSTEHINAAKKHAEIIALAQPAIVPVPDAVLDRPGRIQGIHYVDVNLNGKAFERSLIWKLRYFSLAKVIAFMAFGYRMEAISIIGREILQPRGLVGLGIDTLDHSGVELKELFDVLTGKNAFPILVHCTQGKDRTGIVVVLVLLLCGVDMESITTDYVQSEIELEPERKERMKEISSIGLDESFSKCPKDFPAKIDQHIKEQYGSIEEYLHRIGVQEDQLQQLRSLLTVGAVH